MAAALASPGGPLDCLRQLRRSAASLYVAPGARCHHGRRRRVEPTGSAWSGKRTVRPFRRALGRRSFRRRHRPAATVGPRRLSLCLPTGTRTRRGVRLACAAAQSTPARQLCCLRRWTRQERITAWPARLAAFI